MVGARAAALTVSPVRWPSCSGVVGPGTSAATCTRTASSGAAPASTVECCLAASLTTTLRPLEKWALST